MYKKTRNISRKNPDHTIGDYIKALLESCSLAESYYTKEINVESSKFMKMLLLDGCFILTFICGSNWWSSSNNQNSMPEEIPIELPGQWESNFVMHDLLLVENQIPFFILQKIHKLVTGNQNTTSLSETTAIFVEEILSKYPKSIKESNRPSNFHHLLHLCHMYFRPSKNYDFYDLQPNQDIQTSSRWRQAAEYHRAGVKFVKREIDKNDPHSLLDVRFRDNVMEIPFLQVDENTGEILRNLVELEERSSQYGNDLTSYVIFMSELISNSKDVALLVSKGIIEHYFQTDEEVLDVLMDLSIRVDFDYSGSYYLKNISVRLEAYYQSRMNSWKGWLRRASSMFRGWV